MFFGKVNIITDFYGVFSYFPDIVNIDKLLEISEIGGEVHIYPITRQVKTEEEVLKLTEKDSTATYQCRTIDCDLRFSSIFPDAFCVISRCEFYRVLSAA